MITFQLITSKTVTELEVSVNRELARGWSLWGQTFTLASKKEILICQALTMEVPNPE